MIEIIKEETLEEREERRKKEGQEEIHTITYGIPKNVRQIGNSNGVEKIYIEDYVMTHMKQLAAYGDEKPKVLILYGKQEVIDDQLFWFVSGAVLAEAIDSFMDKIAFDENLWAQINETANRFFNGLSILGWAFLRRNSDSYWDEMIVGAHRKFFRPNQKLFFEYIMNERIENMYLFEKGKMDKQSGFFIYYERNEPMQNYMLAYKEAETEKEEELSKDQATRQCRAIVQEKKDRLRKRHTMGLLYGTSAVLVMVIMIIGITMLNNYEKMQNMEKVLYKISGQMEEAQTVETNGQIANRENVSVSGNMENTNYIKNTNEADKESIETEGVNVLENTNIDSNQDTIKSTTNTSDSLEDNSSTPAGDAPVEPNKEEGTNQATEINKQNAEKQAEETAEETAEEQGEEMKTEKETEQGQAVETTTTVQKEYIIQKGDTLAKISRKFYGTENMIQKICDLNHIENMDNILYGEKILLP